MLKRKISSYAFYIAVFLLSFILFNLLTATILFIFNVGIQSWYLPCALIFSVALTILLMKRRKMVKIRDILIVVVLPICAISGLVIINGKIYDYTWDGNDYHKLAIGMMVDGWNPLMETEYEFNDKNEDNEEKINLGEYKFNWGDNYAKASHIFAANVSKITGNVESGKVLNDISIIIVFLFVFALCLHIEKSWAFSILLAFTVVTPVTIVAQFLTNYVDILVYLYMFLLATLFFWFEYGKEYQKEILGIFFATLIILINIKFSSFAYAGVLCAFYYGWYIYRYKKDKAFDKKFFKKFSLTAFAAVMIGVFVVGLSVYPRNLLTHGHPFYPLMGEGKKDIMTANSPYYFKDKNNIEKFFIATFGEADNIIMADRREAELKIPFTINEREIEFTEYCDIRISGNGLLFSGILIISIIIIMLLTKKTFTEDKKLFIMLALPIVMTLILIAAMSDVWWARYFPQLHFIVFAALIMLSRHKACFTKAILYTFFGVIIINNMMFFLGAIRQSYRYTQSVHEVVGAFKDSNNAEECKMLVGTSSFFGGFYSIRHDYDEYEIIYDDPKALDTTNNLWALPNFVTARCQKK